MNDEQIEKLAIAVTNALNKGGIVGKRKVVDNSKKMLRDAIYSIHKLKIKVIKRNKKTFRAFQEVEENKG